MHFSSRRCPGPLLWVFRLAGKVCGPGAVCPLDNGSCNDAQNVLVALLRARLGGAELFVHGSI